MYCIKCDIEVRVGDHGICPQCSGPLVETPALLIAKSGESKNEENLQDLISNFDATVKQSLEKKDFARGGTVAVHDLILKVTQKAKSEMITEKLKTEQEQEEPFDLEKALSTEDTHLQNMVTVSVTSVVKSASDFTHTKENLDKTSIEITSDPTPQALLNKNPKYGALYTLIVVLIAIMASAAGYYFSFNEEEPEQVKRTAVLPKKIAPLQVPQTQIDKKNQVLNLTVQAQKAADDRQTEPGKKDTSPPIAEKASLPASQMTAPPTHKEGIPSAAIKEYKPAAPAPAIVHTEEKPAPPPEKVITSPQQEAAVNAPLYCVNVSSCKIKESADVVIKNLQKKGYDPAVETIRVKDTTWYRVTVGHFKTPVEAQNYARELQRKDNIKGDVVKKK